MTFTGVVNSPALVDHPGWRLAADREKIFSATTRDGQVVAEGSPRTHLRRVLRGTYGLSTLERAFRPSQQQATSRVLRCRVGRAVRLLGFLSEQVKLRGNARIGEYLSAS